MDLFLWCENDGIGPIPTFTPHILLDFTTRSGAYQAVYGFDVLSSAAGVDILVQVFVQGQDVLQWYRSSPGHSVVLMSENVVSAADKWRMYQFTGFKLVDRDGLGNWDFVIASGADAGISWFSSDGGTPRQFNASTVAIGSYIVDMSVRDVTGDGLADIVGVSANTKGFVRIYRNLGGSPPSFSSQDVSALRTSHVFAAEYVAPEPSSPRPRFQCFKSCIIVVWDIGMCACACVCDQFDRRLRPGPHYNPYHWRL